MLQRPLVLASWMLNYCRKLELESTIFDPVWFFDAVERNAWKTSEPRADSRKTRIVISSIRQRKESDGRLLGLGWGRPSTSESQWAGLVSWGSQQQPAFLRSRHAWTLGLLIP